MIITHKFLSLNLGFRCRLQIARAEEKNGQNHALIKKNARCEFEEGVAHT